MLEVRFNEVIYGLFEPCCLDSSGQFVFCSLRRAIGPRSNSVTRFEEVWRFIVTITD